jgi:hypothetical protein
VDRPTPNSVAKSFNVGLDLRSRYAFLMASINFLSRAFGICTDEKRRSIPLSYPVPWHDSGTSAMTHYSYLLLPALGALVTGGFSWASISLCTLCRPCTPVFYKKSDVLRRFKKTKHTTFQLDFCPTWGAYPTQPPKLVTPPPSVGQH